MEILNFLRPEFLTFPVTGYITKYKQYCSEHGLQNQKWVTNWVSRHVMVTCFQLISNLSTTCKPHFLLKNRV